MSASWQHLDDHGIATGSLSAEDHEEATDGATLLDLAEAPPASAPPSPPASEAGDIEDLADGFAHLQPTHEDATHDATDPEAQAEMKAIWAAGGGDEPPAEEEEGRLTSTSAARPPALGPHVYSAEPPPPPTAGVAREALALTAQTPMTRGQPSEPFGPPG